MSVNGRHVLVVDDEGTMRCAVSEVLKKSGYEVVAAGSGEDALEKFSEGLFNLVITDIKMPGMGGMELLLEIKKRSPRIPVVMMTAFGTIETAVAAMKQGAVDYLLKPFSADILEEVVEGILPQGKAAKKEGLSVDRTIITNSPKILSLLETLRGVADSDATLLIQGESGTGKELFAHYVHNQSSPKGRAFVAVNCAAVPDTLLESELFGHERGAFTGALSKKIGKFEQAHRGTFLLDEIGEMDLKLQAKLLRVLQERVIERVGGSEPVNIDIRVVATTNRDLKSEVEKGKFREDLYYRLNVIPLTIPPLKERPEDISLLTEHFIRKFNVKNGREIDAVAPEALELLKGHSWPGNVRELENAVERAVLLAERKTLTVENFAFLSFAEKEEDSVIQNSGASMRDVEKSLILKTLEEVDGNRTQAAKVLGISIRTLRNRLREYREEKG